MSKIIPGGWIHECGCVFKGERGEEIHFCKNHQDAFDNKKPYSEYVNINRGLCPLCHGYDEVIGLTVCICRTYERRQALDTIRVALKNGMTIDQLEKEDAELHDEVKRIRERRGKEQ